MQPDHQLSKDERIIERTKREITERRSELMPPQEAELIQWNWGGEWLTEEEINKQLNQPNQAHI